MYREKYEEKWSELINECSFLKLHWEENSSVCLLVCIKAIPQFTTQHVRRVWLVVFTAGYPQAQCGLILCLCVCVYACVFVVSHMDVLCHVIKPKSPVWESGLCVFRRLQK